MATSALGFRSWIRPIILNVGEKMDDIVYGSFGFGVRFKMREFEYV